MIGLVDFKQAILFSDRSFSLSVDLLAHVFDVLKADLKSDVAKELFLYYQGTTVVLQYLKPVNKVHLLFCT